MKRFSDILKEIKRTETKDKFHLAEEVYDLTVKEFNTKLNTLRKMVEHGENNATAIANAKNYFFYTGLWSAYNTICDAKDAKTSMIEPQVDANGQPMWLDEIAQRAKG